VWRIVGTALLTAVLSTSPGRAEAGSNKGQAPQLAEMRTGGDWPILGGRPDRNAVSNTTKLFDTWEVDSGENIKWVARLGTMTFGSPVVGSGKLLIGTNNGHPRDSAISGDQGVLMCFAEADGTFLWQAVHDKLPSGDAHDWEGIGICSTPCIAGDRAYYVSNRCELVCVDMMGFDGGRNDGPVTDEKLRGRANADFVWVLDMMTDLGVLPLNASASSPLVVDDLVFVVTGNGTDERTGKVTEPQAPSFIAVHRDTGRLAWHDNRPADRILSGQWSSPACGMVKGQLQVVFPGGDGWLYAYEPRTGKLIWRFDCKSNEPPAEFGKPSNTNTLIAMPVVYRDRVFVAVGRDPEQGDGTGGLWSIDATLTGDVTKTAGCWIIDGDEFGRSVSTVTIHDGLLYAVELGGFLNCMEAMTGKRFWRHDLMATVWGSPLIADEKIYIANKDGEATVLKHGRTKTVLARNTLPDSVNGSMAAVNGVLYFTTSSHLYAMGNTGQDSIVPVSRPSTP